MENLDSNTQYILEVADIIHDIACPLCRKKYGNTNGKRQEVEGVPMVQEFLRDSGMTVAQIERVMFLVGHHHTFTDVDGADHQILLEVDYIANASENNYSKYAIKNFLERTIKTKSGSSLIRQVFRI